MNIDNGDIRPWDSLTMEERSSGRWIKLSDDEFAMAERLPEPVRKIDLMEALKASLRKEEDALRSLGTPG